MQRQVGQYHAFVDVGTRDGFVGVLEVFVQQALLNLKGDLESLQSVLMLPIFLVDAAKVIEAERPELQQLLLRPKVVPNCLVEEHIDALGCQVQLFAEIHATSRHNLDADLIYEGSEFLQESEALRQRLLVLQRRGNQIHQPFMHQYLSKLLRLVLQILMVLLEQQQRLFILILLPEHRSRDY